MIFLQETHLKSNSPIFTLPKKYACSYFASTHSAVRGVAIFLSSALVWEFGKVIHDVGARWIWIEVSVNWVSFHVQSMTIVSAWS